MYWLLPVVSDWVSDSLNGPSGLLLGSSLLTYLLAVPVSVLFVELEKKSEVTKTWMSEISHTEHWWRCSKTKHVKMNLLSTVNLQLRYNN
jgi:hypothetical protein